VEIAGTEDGPDREVLCDLGYHRLVPRVSNDIDATALARLRQRLDAGLGNDLINKYRNLATSAEEWLKEDRSYKVIILGALIMATGAVIKNIDIQYLRQLTSEVVSHENFMWALNDSGFRGPGKRQFLAALDNYQLGTPRGFKEPSCHACGKTKQDTGRALWKCSGCRKGHAWFCDKVGSSTCFPQSHCANPLIHRLASGASGVFTSTTAAIRSTILPASC
jgi:hypothetical protein